MTIHATTIGGHDSKIVITRHEQNDMVYYAANLTIDFKGRGAGIGDIIALGTDYTPEAAVREAMINSRHFDDAYIEEMVKMVAESTKQSKEVALA